MSFKNYSDEEIKAFLSRHEPTLIDSGLKMISDYVKSHNGPVELDTRDKAILFSQLIQTIGNEMQLLAPDADFKTLTTVAVFVGTNLAESATVFNSGKTAKKVVNN